MNETIENPFLNPVENSDQANPSSPSKLVKRVLFLGTCLLIVGVLIALLIPDVQRSRFTGKRDLCMSNLRQIALAIHNYQSVNGRLPPAYTVDESGKPLHSWRTLILPYLEENSLFESIDLTKPWDDPVNEVARTQQVPVYECPSANLKPGYTTYLANAWEKGAMVPETGRLLNEFSDGASNTVLLFEIGKDEAVEWMSPHDGENETFSKTIRGRRLSHPGFLYIAMADGLVRAVDSPKSSSEKYLPFFTIAEGDKAEWPK